jgi:hypothetical protein
MAVGARYQSYPPKGPIEAEETGVELGTASLTNGSN